MSMINIEQTLKNLENKPEEIIVILPRIIDEINYLRLRIKYCRTFEETKSYFDLIDIIQLPIAKLHYKYGIKLSSIIMKFIHDFNLLHEESERKKIYDELQAT